MTLPKISIVTPSFNQGRFLEETIQSVILQNYQDMEYLIMDGGSTDDSAQIIRKYEPRLTYWVSERDKGQADAIFRGFKIATGDILGYLNSDDLLLPGALDAVSEYFQAHPHADAVVGGSFLIDGTSAPILLKKGFFLPNCNVGTRITHHRLLYYYCTGFHQPAVFWRRTAYEKAGGFDTSLSFSFDYDLFLRLSKAKPFGKITRFLAAFREHESSKSNTIRDVMCRENELLWKRYGRYKKSVLYLRTVHEFYKRLDRFNYFNTYARFRLGVSRFPSQYLTDRT